MTIELEDQNVYKKEWNNSSKNHSILTLWPQANSEDETFKNPVT